MNLLKRIVLLRPYRMHTAWAEARNHSIGLLAKAEALACLEAKAATCLEAKAKRIRSQLKEVLRRQTFSVSPLSR